MSQTDKCIVLDLDETCVHTFQTSSLDDLKIYNDVSLQKRLYKFTINDATGKRGGGADYNFAGAYRPHLRKFLKFCFKYFKVVAVWSAGTKEYVHAVVNDIFRGIRKPMVIYSRDDCIKRGSYYVKPLKKMIRNVKGLNKYMSLSNTFILDDKYHTFLDNKDNGILIPEYRPEKTKMDILKDNKDFIVLIKWFQRKEVKNSKDIRTLNKTDIFD